MWFCGFSIGIKRHFTLLILYKFSHNFLHPWGKSYAFRVIWSNWNWECDVNSNVQFATEKLHNLHRIVIDSFVMIRIGVEKKPRRRKNPIKFKFFKSKLLFGCMQCARRTPTTIGFNRFPFLFNHSSSVIPTLIREKQNFEQKARKSEPKIATPQRWTTITTVKNVGSGTRYTRFSHQIGHYHVFLLFSVHMN